MFALIALVSSFFLKDRLTTAMNEKLNDIVFIRDAQLRDKTANKLNGIRDIYQFRFTNTFDSRHVMYRSDPCWCGYCSVGNYEACLTGQEWITLDLAPRATRTPRTHLAAATISTEDTVDNPYIDRLVANDMNDDIEYA